MNDLQRHRGTLSPRSRGLGLGHRSLGQSMTAYGKAFSYRALSPPQTLAALAHADLVLQYEERGRVRESECPVCVVCVCIRRETWGQYM